MSAFRELASVAYLEGRTDRGDAVQRRAAELLLDERAREDERQRREIRRLVARGLLSKRTVARALSPR